MVLRLEQTCSIRGNYNVVHFVEHYTITLDPQSKARQSLFPLLSIRFADIANHSGFRPNRWGACQQEIKSFIITSYRHATIYYHKSCAAFTLQERSYPCVTIIAGGGRRIASEEGTSMSSLAADVL